MEQQQLLLKDQIYNCDEALISATEWPRETACTGTLTEEMPLQRKSKLSRAEAAKIARSEESPLQTELRRQKQAMRQAAWRAVESPSQRQERLERQASRQARLRASETRLQTQRRLDEQAERQARLRASETSLQTQSRLKRQAERQAAIRARETPEQLQARRKVHAKLQAERRRRQNFMRNNWPVLNSSKFHYDPTHNIITIL